RISTAGRRFPKDIAFKPFQGGSSSCEQYTADTGSSFFNDADSTKIYTLTLHDALPIYGRLRRGRPINGAWGWQGARKFPGALQRDRKSTRLNSSHVKISYAVFCLKKKKKKSRHWFSVRSTAWAEGRASTATGSGATSGG